MSDNAKQMTLEERIVQNLKDDSLMKLVGDEDAITELVKRALHEALFQPRRVLKTYGGYEEKDSVVVATAREAARKACEAAVPQLVEDMLKRPEVRSAMVDVIAFAIPGVVAERIGREMRDAADAATNALREAIRQGDPI